MGWTYSTSFGPAVGSAAWDLARICLQDEDEIALYLLNGEMAFLGQRIDWPLGSLQLTSVNLLK